MDQFWSMDYSACGMPYAGMAEAPWRWVNNSQRTMDALGFPREKVVHVFPWHGCDYNCGRAGNPWGGVNCSHLAPKGTQVHGLGSSPSTGPDSYIPC